MKKSKKVIVTVILIVFIVLVAWGIVNHIQQKELKNKVETLIANEKNYTNYTYEFTPNQGNERLVVKRKDNLTKATSSDLDIYHDYNTKEVIGLKESNKTKIIGNEDSIISMANVELYPNSYLKNDSYKIKSIKEENCCYIIKLKNSDEIVEVKIDKINGFVMEIKHLNSETTNGTIFPDEGKYNIIVNNVTDSEVEVPDTSDYRIKEISE